MRLKEKYSCALEAVLRVSFGVVKIINFLRSDRLFKPYRCEKYQVLPGVRYISQSLRVDDRLVFI